MHRLIALTFVDGFQDGFQVNHINGIKADFRPENLEWVPLEENVRHAWRGGIHDKHRGNANFSAKLTPRRVRAIRKMLAIGVRQTTIAIACDVSPDAIRKIRLGLTWQHVME